MILRSFLACLLALFAQGVGATIIFQDNFDNNCTGAACYSSGGWSLVPTGWEGWGTDGGTTATHDSVTHYSGEITSPGRGGAGKSMKLWRHSTSWEGYTGPLVKYYSANTSDFYMRFYAKLPVALDLTSGYLKLWRFNLNGGNEFYLNFNNPLSGAYRGRAELQLLSGGSGWVTLLNASQLLALWDGNWHAWQFRFNLTTKTVTFWMDGTQISQVTMSGMPSGESFGTQIQHFPLGNLSSGALWQSSWQAFEVDDLVLATTKAETDPIGGVTNPTVQSVSCTQSTYTQAPGGIPCTMTYSGDAPTSYAWTLQTPDVNCSFSAQAQNTTLTCAYGGLRKPCVTVQPGGSALCATPSYGWKYVKPSNLGAQ